MIIVDERAATQRAARFLAPRAPTSFMDNFASSAHATLMSETTISESLSMERAYDSYIGEIHERTGARLDNPISETVPDLVPSIGIFDTPDRVRDLTRQRRLDRFQVALSELAQKHEGAFEIRSPERLREDAFAIVHGAIEANERVAAGAQTAGKVGQFVGAAAGTIADPPVLASMFVGAPAATGILRTMMIEAGLAGVTEAAIQPRIQRFRAEAGLPSGVAEAFKNIGLATVGGGAFAGVIRGAVGGARVLSGGLRDIRVRNAQEQAAARYLERQAALQEETPFGPAGQAEHVARTSQAQRDLAEGVPSRNAEEPQAATRPVESESGAALRQARGEESGIAEGAAGAGADLRARALAETVDVDRLRANRDTARELDALPDLDAMLDTARRGLPRPKGLRSLIDTLRNAGGIRDQGGELRHIGITGRTRPGLVNNRSGMTLDDAGLLAFESGFFGPNRAGFGERPTTSDLLDRLRDDFEGRRVFRDEDRAVLDEFDQVQAGVEAFRQKFDDLGLDLKLLSNDELRGALRATLDEPLPQGRGAGTGRQDADLAARAAAEATDGADAVDDVLEVAVRTAYGERLDAEIWMGEGDEILRRRAGDVLDEMAEEDAHIKEWFACLEGTVATGAAP